MNDCDPAPAPVAAVLIDALNLAHWCGRPASLRVPLALLPALLARGDQPMLCFDASARYQLQHEAEVYAELLAQPSLAFEVRSGIPADRVLLQQARKTGAAIISRDRFRDHRRRYRKLIDDPLRLQAGYVSNDRVVVPGLLLDAALPATATQAWVLVQAWRLPPLPPG